MRARLRRLGSELDELLLGRLGEAVVERRSAQAVAVGHLDDRDAGGVECADDVAYLLRHELVPLVVRAVAQAGVGQAQVEVARRVGLRPGTGEGVDGGVDTGYGSSAHRRISLAIDSPTCVAAAVMMSRFPAYGGR